MSRRKQTTTITISEGNYRRLLDLKIKRRDVVGKGNRVIFDSVITALLDEHYKAEQEKVKNDKDGKTTEEN